MAPTLSQAMLFFRENWAILPAMQTQQKQRLFIIDGNSYIYRAFYAIRNLSMSQGLPTNAVFGFVNMLLNT